MHRLFPSQLDSEKIFLIVRQHWVELILKLLIWLFFAFTLILFQRFTTTNIPGLWEGQAGIITKVFTTVYSMFLILALLLIWIIYYLNIQVITNVRIVDIDQQGLFSHTVSELHIENIEDVTSETTGILGTIFNYGSVFVQTAGTKERFEFESVPNPASIEKMILDLYDQIPPEKRKGKE